MTRALREKRRSARGKGYLEGHRGGCGVEQLNPAWSLAQAVGDGVVIQRLNLADHHLHHKQQHLVDRHAMLYCRIAGCNHPVWP